MCLSQWIQIHIMEKMAPRKSSWGLRTNFSGGPKARCRCARGSISSSTYSDFDDSTSALDAKSRAFSSGSLRQKGLEGTAAIIIAQRLAPVVHADKILSTGSRTIDWSRYACRLSCQYAVYKWNLWNTERKGGVKWRQFNFWNYFKSISYHL